MSNALDMSLDDLIKNNKKSSTGGKGQPPSGHGPARWNPNRSGNRLTPYGFGKAPEAVWQHDMFLPDQSAAANLAPAVPRASSIELGTKLYISNLDYGVSNEDIKELFSEVGDLRRYSIHYDRSGRSKGTAEVVFTRREDAVAAVKRYNDVQLDGKPMKIEVIGTNIMTPVPMPIVGVANGAFTNSNSILPRSVLGRVGANGYSRGALVGRGGGGRQRGGRRRRGGSSDGRGGRNEPISAEALDADLDKYHQEAMQTN